MGGEEQKVKECRCYSISKLQRLRRMSLRERERGPREEHFKRKRKQEGKQLPTRAPLKKTGQERPRTLDVSSLQRKEDMGTGTVKDGFVSLQGETPGGNTEASPAIGEKGHGLLGKGTRSDQGKKDRIPGRE